MSRVIHFDITADDPERAMQFYATIFGWEFQKWDGPMDYWLITTGPEDQPGINGGMSRREPDMPSANTIDVASVDECVARVTEQGGTVVSPKMAIPGVGYMAYLTDTEGNVFGIMQNDPTAE